MTRRKWIGALGALALATGSVSAWAGAPMVTAFIEYQPDPDGGVASVPTLGEWTLVLLALLVAVVAYRALRGRVNGTTLMSLLALFGVATIGIGTGQLDGQAEAASQLQIELDNPAGGQASIPYFGIYAVENASGVAQTITALELNYPPGMSLGNPSSTPTCTVGLRLQDGSLCYINLVPPEEGELT